MVSRSIGRLGDTKTLVLAEMIDIPAAVKDIQQGRLRVAELCAQSASMHLDKVKCGAYTERCYKKCFSMSSAMALHERKLGRAAYRLPLTAYNRHTKLFSHNVSEHIIISNNEKFISRSCSSKIPL